MCGIVGLFSPVRDSETRAATLSALTRTLKHRGPDNQGEWWDKTAPLGLAQRRLAIVDLSADGHQPMVSSSGRYVVSFNGEIYNFQELRDDLERRGVHFRSRSDTEVLLAAIDAEGLNRTCQKINGMFAMLLWDIEKQELHLIRDRMGKKPLYFGWAGADFLCASELRTFMAHPQFNREVSPQALAHYLHLGFVPAPLSIFSDVSMVLPGCRVVIPIKDLKPSLDLRARMDPYWSPARVVEEARGRRVQMAGLSLAERTQQTEDVIERAVTSRMITDVPLGAFLSGGIDSSLVVALMQKNARGAIKTYSIGFSESGYDESHHAQKVAEHLGTDHHAQILRTDEALSIITDLPNLCDEPMADVSFLSTYLVAKLARQDVTVALSGDGGDELFGGYYRHTHINRIWSLLPFLPKAAREMVQNSLREWGPRLVKNPQSLARVMKLAALLRFKNLPDIYEFLAGHGEDNIITSGKRLVDGYPFRASTTWPTGLKVPEWMMFADTVHYLPNNVLAKVDRATMAVSLEARAPLLDMNVFAHAWSLPMSDKISGGQGKQILRRVLERHVPRDLFERPKQGFAVPIGEWLRGGLHDHAKQHIFSGVLAHKLGIDDVGARAVWQAHQSRAVDAPQTLWRLLVLAQWAEKYL